MMPKPPADPTLAIAVNQRRRAVIGQLSQAFALDRLDVEELDRRIGLAQQANSIDDLEALLEDLESAPVASDPPQSTLSASTPALIAPSTLAERTIGLARRSETAVTAAASPRSETMVAILGGVERRGRWVVPPLLHVHCILGGVNLDFREADLSIRVIEVSVTCLMGGVNIIVPPHVSVDVAGSAVLGGFEQSPPWVDPPAVEPSTRIRITGLVIAGGVSVETRRIGESARDARKREKIDRKSLRERQQQPMLPAAVALPERKSKR